MELVNFFKTGRSGHFALVCACPNIDNASLKKGDAIPAAAGIIGYVSDHTDRFDWKHYRIHSRDVLKELLQVEIYDENDRKEKEARMIAYVNSLFSLYLSLYLV